VDAFFDVGLDPVEIGFEAEGLVPLEYLLGYVKEFLFARPFLALDVLFQLSEEALDWVEHLRVGREVEYLEGILDC